MTTTDAPAPSRFVGRTVLITGSTGIAAASARRIAAEGGTVFVATRTAAHGEALVAELRTIGAQADLTAVDLLEPEAAGRAVDACVAVFGRLDAVFNVAGGSGRKAGDGPVDQATAAGWDATLDLNARSLFLVCGAAVRVMLGQERDRDGGRGSILNMSSILSRHPSPAYFGTHAYAAAKGAINALTVTMAARYAADGIRVNAVLPSLTRTPMAGRAAADPATVAYATWKQPLAQGLLEADDIAPAAAFLLSGDAARITGQLLEIDGGFGVTEMPRQPTEGESAAAGASDR